MADFTPDFLNFLLTIIFSFLIGLEIKTYNLQYVEEQGQIFFGTTRTFTFVGILGYLFYKIDPSHLIIYGLGFIGLTVFYALVYYRNLQKEKYSILPFLILQLVYSLGAISSLYPFWIPAFIFVLTVFILNQKNAFRKISERVNVYEFETFSKMILLSAVILPLLPKTHIIPYIPLSPFKIWFAVVVISAISYGGYIMQKYLFPSKGFFLTGLIGGTYSSTATTIVLSRKLKEAGHYSAEISAGIVIATSVMFLRIIVIAFVFNAQIGKMILIPFITLSFFSLLFSLWFLREKKNHSRSQSMSDTNPLELGTAFAFTLLFIIMIVLTQFITAHYGNAGLQVFSFIAGFTDIDPFILSVLTGKYNITQTEIISAVMIASGSNNLMKAGYALYFGGIRNALASAGALIILGGIMIGWALL